MVGPMMVRTAITEEGETLRRRDLLFGAGTAIAGVSLASADAADPSALNAHETHKRKIPAPIHPEPNVEPCSALVASAAECVDAGRVEEVAVYSAFIPSTMARCFVCQPAG